MDQLIKLILEEELSDKAFNQMEIRLFKFANKFKKELGTQEKMINFFNNSIKTFNIPESDARYYYEVYTLNYRPAGDYENVTKSEFKDPKRFSKPKKVTNSQSGELVANKLPFQGSNLRGFWWQGRNNEWTYVVDSYGWFPIYAFKFNTWFQVDNNYSSSTSKHMSNSHPLRYNSSVGTEMLVINSDEMKKIIHGHITLEDLIGDRKNSFSVKLSPNRNKLLFTTIGYGEDKIKVTFKITQIRVINGKPKLKIVVTNVEKMSDRKIIKDDGSFFRGEMENVSKDSIIRDITSLINDSVSHKLLAKPGMINVDVDFEYTPSVGRSTSFWTFYNTL
jgi:hypothetical protein